MLSSTDHEILDLIFANLGVKSQGSMAITCKKYNEHFSNERYAWYRILCMMRKYEFNKNGYASYFSFPTFQNELLDRRSIVALSSVPKTKLGKFDVEMFSFSVFDMQKYGPIESHIFAAIIDDLLLLDKTDDIDRISDMDEDLKDALSENAVSFVISDRLDMLKKYCKITEMKGKLYYYAIKSIKNGAPNVFKYLVEKIEEECNGCLCKLTKATESIMTVVSGKLSARKYHEIPLIMCKIHDSF